MSRRLPLIFVAVLTLIGVVVAGVAIAASGVGGSAVAYAVNGTEVSQATVDHQLKEIADRRNVKNVAALFGTPATATKGSTSSSTTATWLTIQIRRELYRQAAAKANVKVSDADRAAVRRAFDQQLQSGNAPFRVADLPRSVQDALLDVLAYPAALRLTSNAANNAFVTRAVRRSDISVDPRYGRWNARQAAVCAPTGCATTAAGG
jgi:hypothetical protein